ncbi:MAG: hypothetical protein ACRC51_10335 [Cetobacterium sp.]
MGYLVCKVNQSSGKSCDKIKIISKTDENLYTDIEGLKVISYNPNYKLEEDQIFVIESADTFITNKEILENFETKASTYEELEGDKWSKVAVLVFSNNNKNYYQRIIGKKYLNTKVVLKFVSTRPQITEEIEGIALNPNSFIIYDIENKKLYFKNFSEVSKIFKGIEVLYREATEEEVKKFFSNDLVDEKSAIGFENITSAKRKKILLALSELEKGKEIEKLRAYGKKYYPSHFESDKILVNSLDNIDVLINVVHEHCYTSEVTNQKKIANSTMDLV